MAVTLTKSYQKISTIPLTYGEIRTYAKYTSQNSTTNKTTYYLKSTYYATLNVSFDSATAKLDGTSKSYGYTTMPMNKETTIQEVSRTITHNANGTSPEKSVKTEWSATFGGSGSKTATIKMPTINRIATVTSATDFTDEGNPTVSFSNPAGFTIKPYINFYDNNSVLVKGISRNVSATSPYTWSLSESERQSIRSVTNKQTSYRVQVGVETYSGSTLIGYHSIAKKMTYVNATPSETTTFVETNQKVIDILGSATADTIIQNVSSLKLTSTPTVLKSATVSKIQFQHNNIVVAKTSGPYEYVFKPVNSIFKTTITDSRGYVVTNQYTKDIIEYLPIEISSFSFKRANPTSSDVVLNAQIRYKQAKFGESDNVPTIQWKCGENGELYTLTSEDYTLDSENNKITISNLTLSDILPYTQESRFYLYASDLLTEDTENEPVLKGIPTCDMGEHDFQVNGELYIADESRANKKEIRELFFPVGSVYVTNTNVSPETYLNGTWELINKGFINAYLNDTAGELFTANTTNVSSYQVALTRNDGTIRIRFNCTLKVDVEDTTVVLGNLNFANIGISRITSGYSGMASGNDGGNCIFVYNVAHDDGEIAITDVVGKTENKIPKGTTIYVDFTFANYSSYMLDGACDKFYWEKVA